MHNHPSHAPLQGHAQYDFYKQAQSGAQWSEEEASETKSGPEYIAKHLETSGAPGYSGKS